MQWCARSYEIFDQLLRLRPDWAYGVNLPDLFRDVAAFVDQVARGGKAGEIPMRTPSHFHIAFNLKTTKALGLEIPPTLLARADEVIE